MARLILNIVSLYLGLGVAFTLGLIVLAAVVINLRNGKKIFDGILMLANYLGTMSMILLSAMWPLALYKIIKGWNETPEMDTLEYLRFIDDCIEEFENGH